MKKIIEIKKEVQIGNVILEKGDKIEVLKESTNVISAGFKSVFEREDLPSSIKDTPVVDVIVKYFGIPFYVRETKWNYELIFTHIWKQASERYRGIKNSPDSKYTKEFSLGQISYDQNVDPYVMISIEK